MKYSLIRNNEIVASSNNFDSLVNLADRDMDGYVVETKDWEAQQKAIEANRVHMQKDGIKLTGENLVKIRRAGVKLTNDEFIYLMRHTFVHGEYGADIDVFYSAVNQNHLAQLATPEQRKMLGQYIRKEAYI